MTWPVTSLESRYTGQRWKVQVLHRTGRREDLSAVRWRAKFIESYDVMIVSDPNVVKSRGFDVHSFPLFTPYLGVPSSSPRRLRTFLPLKFCFSFIKSSSIRQTGRGGDDDDEGMRGQSVLSWFERGNDNISNNGGQKRLAQKDLFLGQWGNFAKGGK